MTCIEIMDRVLAFNLSLMIFCIMTHNAVCSRNICLLWSLVVMDCVTWHNLWSWNTDVYHTFSLTVYHTSFYVICFCQSDWQCVTLSVHLCLFLRVTVAYLLKLQGKLQFAFMQGRHALKNNFRGKKRLVIKAHLNLSVARLLIFNNFPIEEPHVLHDAERYLKQIWTKPCVSSSHV